MGKITGDDIKKFLKAAVPILLYVAERMVSDKVQEKMLENTVRKEVEEQLAERQTADDK